MGALDGRVALITGAARGQGRAHALALAAAGADIVAADAPRSMVGLTYPLGTEDDLRDTARRVGSWARAACRSPSTCATPPRSVRPSSRH
jgi:NAD(P)-dependent dehydrogenase (short-subunit alcohol dehydrogenase family)